MKRRSFLGGLIAAPFAAKQAAEQTAMGLAKVDVGNAADYVFGAPKILSAPDTGIEQKPVQWVVKHLSKQFPEWLEESLRRDNSHVHVISPDIATMRSVSLSSKYSMQKQRQLKSAKDRLLRDLHQPWKEERDKFGQMTGWWF